MRPIFIIGYMASGKTTFGKALARELSYEFIDLDFYIEQRFHKSVRQIFADNGEEGFRNIEKEMLHEVGEFNDVVISCGGGTPCFFDNIDFMRGKGLTVMLNTPPERIIERLVANNSKRPLMAGKSNEEIRIAVNEGLANRLPYYSKAEVSFCGSRLEDKSQIANTVREFLELHADRIAGI